MKITVRESELFTTVVKARMPFRYGIATMTQTPHAFARITAEIDGRVHRGVSADHLPPKWFTKDPHRPIEDELVEMKRVVVRALRRAEGTRAASAFALWRELYDDQAAWGAREGLAPLLTHFGVTLVERAVIDAVCRAADLPFARAVHAGVLGIALADVRPELAGSSPSDWLPAAPLASIQARHTVGLGDPLEDADITDADHVHDDLPQSLAACIRFYGLKHFKIKLSAENDASRLRQIATILDRECAGDFAFSLDGNERFESAETFRAFWEELASSPGIERFLDRLLFVEQPFLRSFALDESIGEMFAQWTDHPPIIIDESDAELRSLPTALALGYSGTSHKNCKGVFKGLANACLVRKRQREQPARQHVLSGEDLSNIGPVALMQDLAAQAALGIESVERNGHHYFAGLSVFPDAIGEAVLRHHGDCYVRDAAGWARVHIQEGRMNLASVNAAPFGVGFDVPLDACFVKEDVHAPA
jgi:hypothetical protein